MNHPTTGIPVTPSGAGALRFDIVAGLTAAAVVLPKAMAYATVAGLPVAVGLYTAFIPMAIYALLGTSRVLSVSSTTTLAILAGTELGLVVPDGDPSRLVTATATLTALVGAMLLIARLLRLGFVANFISTPVLTGFKAGIGLVIVLDQVPKLLGIHITKQGFFADVVSVAQHVPDTSLITLAVAVATFAVLIGMEKLWPHSPAPLVAVGGGIAASWLLRPQRGGRLDRGPHSPGLSVADPAGPPADRAARAGRARDRADELHRNDRRRSRVRPPRRTSHRCESRAHRHGSGQPGRCAFRRNAGRRRHVADGGRAVRGRAVAEDIARHRGCGARHDAAAGAGAGAHAPRDARCGGHRLLGRADPAGGVPRHPRRANDGVPVGADRLRRGSVARHAERHRRRDRRVDDRTREPDRSSAGVCNRTQARSRRAATTVARTSGRRDVRRLADRPPRRTPVLRQRAIRRRTDRRAGRRSTSPACWHWT